MPAAANSDPSLLGLLAANAVALILALKLHMSLRDLMLAYWIQSMTIGAMHVVRILKLRNFDTEGMTIAGRYVPETDSSKSYVALFFAAHYGFFHLIYLMFILYIPGLGRTAHPFAYLLCALAFLVHHWRSLRHTLERDAAGKPALGAMMVLPYARVVPMHLMMIGAAMLGGSTANSILMFGTLKTIADVAMHILERRVPQKSGSGSD